ncbi:hypothetical protein [Curtobacterium sp. MCPF17_052]|uniref:hypothetical protein n=1 Tax=Curtobacterium sp. MCPF17_052 TaxID=2175655 RepID=UPI000DA90676|nr:hypothetical protein [Curtobacterium sp. MCPF17_052]WIB12604.1 hypothetical protein DEJ36_00035 [Curtobacterium sp. MCPF17_052]
MPIDDALLERWMQDEDVALADFGGAGPFLDDVERLIGVDPLTVTEVVCTYWSEFSTFGDRAVAALTGAAAAVDPEIDAVHDVLLGNPEVLTAIADQLIVVVAEQATTDGLFGDIASETWTRLALGDWCSSYSVRGHLQQRVAQVGASASIHLVRAVAAAVNGWDDVELLPTMQALGELDAFEGDVQFELALRSLAAVGTAQGTDEALAHLRDAVARFESAERHDGRVDAAAYLATVRALLRFADGGVVTDDDVAAARFRVNDYIRGYRGLRRHWRQGHADVCSGWVQLTDLLAAAASADDQHWFAPATVISAAGTLYSAETSIELVVRDKGDAAQRGISALVRPRLAEAFAAHQPAEVFLDTWLASVSTGQSQDLIDGVRQLRADLEARSGPKAEGGTDDNAHAASIAQIIRDAAAAVPTPDRSDIRLVRRIIGDISRIAPDAVSDCGPELAALVLALVRFAGWVTNQPQTGPRLLPFLGPSVTEEGKNRNEAFLADSICGWLLGAGLTAEVEPQAIAGDRADVRVTFPGCRFYVEVKRILSTEEDGAAAAHYGDQAAQYAVTSEPITFLALLDYSRRVTRLDLDTAIWTTSHSLPEVQRAYALTGIRIQANVATPSAATKAYRRGRTKTREASA